MLFPFNSFKPKIHPSVFIHPAAMVTGQVSLSDHVSVWPGVSIRADFQPVKIGEASNIQDNAVLHVTPKQGVRVGKFVSIGHGAIVHACTIGDHCIVGMGSVVLSGARIGKNCMLAAGTVILENACIPAGSLVVGVPGKVKRRLSKAEQRALKGNALEYLELAAAYRGSKKNKAKKAK